MKKHRRLLVRNTLKELEADYVILKQIGFEVDPDFAVDTTVQQALMDIHNEHKTVTCGIYIMLEDDEEVVAENGRLQVRIKEA